MASLIASSPHFEEKRHAYYVHMHDTSQGGAPLNFAGCCVYTPKIMPRQKKRRYCRSVNGYNLFKPAGIPMAELPLVELGLDELEAMRQCDLEGRQQEEAAAAMGISRGTVQRLLQSGRTKILTALTEGQALSLGDADYVCTDPKPARGWRHRGEHRDATSPGPARAESEP